MRVGQGRVCGGHWIVLHWVAGLSCLRLQSVWEVRGQGLRQEQGLQGGQLACAVILPWSAASCHCQSPHPQLPLQSGLVHGHWPPRLHGRRLLHGSFEKRPAHYEPAACRPPLPLRRVLPAHEGHAHGYPPCGPALGSAACTGALPAGRAAAQHQGLQLQWTGCLGPGLTGCLPGEP